MTESEGVAQALVPYYIDGTKKSRYLSYLIANFSVMESCKLANVSLRTVRTWRETDPHFVELEERSSSEIRKQLADTLLDIEFTRNFRLVLAKDFQILFKDAQGQSLTDKEQQYLLVIRKFYTPQQLVMLRQLLVGGDGAPEAFDFTRTVLEIRLSREEGHVR